MMDISKQYIKMCDYPKFQIQHNKWKDGDFYTVQAGIGVGMIFVWVSGEEELQEIYTPTWLPRQDQIQEMCREYYAQEMGSKRPHDEWFPKGDIGLGYVFNGFIKFASDYMREIYNSFEQLWLAFYMHEKHQKIWDGKKWIK